MLYKTHSVICFLFCIMIRTFKPCFINFSNLAPFFAAHAVWNAEEYEEQCVNAVKEDPKRAYAYI